MPQRPYVRCTAPTEFYSQSQGIFILNIPSKGASSSQMSRDGSCQLEPVLTILLQGGQCTAVERLAWFCTSKGLAELVLRHAACTHLKLTPPAASAAGATAARGSGSSSSITAHAEAAQQLAAQSHCVTLSLRGGLLTPAACLWQCITTIQLHDMQLSHSSASQLRLHNLSHLHTLSLRHCRMAANSTSSATRHQHRSRSVRTLECLDCWYDVLQDVAFDLVDTSQLQTLITDHASVTNLLPQLPALQELRINPVSYGGTHVNDANFQQLLAHPRLARVYLANVWLRQSHADNPCAWDNLHLDWIMLTELARMPLSGIKSCVVHGRLIVGYTAEAVAAALSNINALVDRMQCVVLQANTYSTGCFWTPPQPCFWVQSKLTDDHTLVQLLTFVMHHLAPGTALVLQEVDIGSRDVVASLAAAPATLTTISFVTRQAADMDDDVSVSEGLLTHMPHVQHVVLGAYGHTPLAWWLSQLRLLVAGVSRPLRLTLVSRHACLVLYQAAILQWVATHASAKVSVGFQMARAL